MSERPRRAFVVDAALLDTLAQEGWAPLPREVYKHALRVLRLDEGDALELRDGAGRTLLVRIQRREALRGAAAAGPVRAASASGEREVHLIVALFKAQRFRWLLEKAAELGASSIRAFVAERSVVRPDSPADDDSSTLVERGERILREATRQSGGTRVPALTLAPDLHTALEDLPANTLIILASPGAPARLGELELGGAERPVALVTGPEGGLTPAEAQRLEARGALAVSLGPRILRAETAPLAVLAALRLR